MIFRALLLLLASAGVALAQGSVQQFGPVTPGHGVIWGADGIIQDGGLLPTSGNFAPHVPDNTNLAATGLAQLATSRAPSGVWRDDFAAGYGASPLFFVPLVGTCVANGLVSDGGSCVDTTIGDGNSWAAKFPSVGADLRQWGVRANGVASDDVAFAAAARWCTSVGGRLALPPGRITMTGTATVVLDHCHMFGISATDSTDETAPGTEVRLLSTTVQPFTCKSYWSLSRISFFWPNQQGSTITAYPPLVKDDGTAAGCNYIDIDHIDLVNPYDGFLQTLGVNWLNWKVNDNRMWAVHRLFTISQTTDSWRILDNQFHHSICVARTDIDCNSLLLTAVQTSVLFYVNGSADTLAHGGIGGLIFQGNTTYAWRYGFYLDTNAEIENSFISALWDGIGTVLEVHNGCLYNTQFSGQANTLIVGPGNTATGTAPAFNVQAGAFPAICPSISALWLWNFQFQQNQGDLVDVSNTNTYLSNVLLTNFGFVNDSGTYYAVHVIGSVPSELILDNTQVVPAATDTKHRGILAGPMNRVIIRNTEFLGVCKPWDLAAANAYPIQTTNIFIDGTPAACQASPNLFSFGVATDVTYANVRADFAPVATVPATHATFNGHIAGTTLTMDNTLVGTIAKNQIITGAGVTDNTFITGGSGSVWTVSISQTVGSSGSPVSFTGDGCGGAGATVLGQQSVLSGAIQTGATSTSACHLTLQVPPPGNYQALCQAFLSTGISLIPIYLSMYDVILRTADASSLANQQIVWTCPGSQ